MKVELPETVRGRLRVAPSNELRQLVVDHSRLFGLAEIRQILLNPFVSEEILGELASSRILVSEYAVKAALVRHRRTPQNAAFRLMPTLFWRDLMEVSLDMRIAPPVRRVAEKYLILRLPSLAVGERVALARRANVEVLRRLTNDEDPRVLRAWLDNARLTEQDVVGMIASSKSSPRGLDIVAKHSRWGRRVEIRRALVRNARTPFRVLFELLPAMTAGDLAVVAELDAHSGIVRRRARDLLSERSPGGVPGVTEEDVVHELSTPGDEEAGEWAEVDPSGAPG